MQSEMAKRLSGIEERTRMIESRVEEVGNRFESFRMNAIRNQNDVNEKVKTLIKATVEMKRRTDDMKEVLRRVERKLLKTASRAELMEIEAYLNILNPVALIRRGRLKSGD
ncbi:MAG: hypothetical protein GOV00_03475 [Candidatus Altiarchaeota archaeon]|nr:hypothetical protein [Candidatus Altiarchaeota archaeon]